MTPVPLLLLFTAGVAVAGYGLVRYSRRALRDPYDATAIGTVVESDLDAETSARRGDYTPAVSYEYVVDGVTYRHDRVRANTDPLSRRGGTVLLGEFHEDAEVTVHYDAADPERAVLVPPEGGGSWLVLAVAGSLVAIVAAALGVAGV
ncbi:MULTISPECIES: DUF3592 domain-containing protein [Halomicrobium]|uniref:DUF3592 domain-containing protein n=2 Tax=Halomicrobium mukohataei TaxID=57705 RepID=C7NZU1_HALMD|nr:MULTISPECIES: DUF3592 domain-containing protein [Halomicrobium]ACV46849.1 hypothetical protein Hmuk_0718 [Halomicrobium mukohataei DSM 12286]QCD65350.1 DUF3592 domain-containing protein [Halomicrobium mukohataei]QFR20156.1 DUF3592 domain-containing protein [Halomicrobium sp. ZPS1]